MKITACILSQYFFDSKTRLFSNTPWTYTRCEEKVQEHQMAVGGFTPDGLDLLWNNDTFNNIGVAAMRKF